MFTALRHLHSSWFYKKRNDLTGMCQAFCKVAMYASNSHRPFHHIAIDESFPSTSLQIQNNLVQISFNIAHTFPDSSSCFSRQLTRCTSTVRLGTSYLAQKQTKTRPTRDSTTPPRVKPLPTYNITSSLLFLEKTRARFLSIVHHHLLLLILFSRVMLLAVDLFNRSLTPYCACGHMIRTILPSPKPLYRSSTIFQYAFSKLFLENLKTWPHCTSPSRPPSQDWTGINIFYPFCKKLKINWKSWLN